uniref:(northern house mosquito) hypothetical protein n=1 Tax=Culex pipiens TaxID=7175 RepID=A0A8D8MQR0_CULPI
MFNANSAVRLTRRLECQRTPVGGQISGPDSVRDHPPHVRTGSLLHPSRMLQGHASDTALPPAGSRLERHRLQLLGRRRRADLPGPRLQRGWRPRPTVQRQKCRNLPDWGLEG